MATGLGHDTEIYVANSAAHDGYAIWVTTSTHQAQPVDFILVPRKLGEYCSPTLILDYPQAQKLFQGLWDSGLRPNNGEGTAGHVQALKYHLEDMRSLVFKLGK